MNLPVYVIGHKIPDTDSICGALALAELKQKMGVNAMAARIGHLNPETRFILDKLNVESPQYMTTARNTLAEIEIDEAYTVYKGDTLRRAWDICLENNTKTLYVVDENDNLVGMTTIGEISRIQMQDLAITQQLLSQTPIENLEAVLKGKILLKGTLPTNGQVRISDKKLMERDLRGAIMILDDAEDDMLKSMGRGCAIICIAENYVPNDYIIDIAKSMGVTLINTPYNTMKMIQMIYRSIPVELIMTPAHDIIRFNKTEFIQDVEREMLKTRHSSYPVMFQDKLVGSVARYHLLKSKKKQFILIDHNERKQSISDIDYADIIEIVDHHRIGDIETDKPIVFRNMIVGSSCTIVGLMYSEYGIEMSETVAKLICYGIISDTLNFHSPTCTETDRILASRLEKQFGFNHQNMATELFENTATIKGKTFRDILYNDCKEYTLSGKRVAISQVFIYNLDVVDDIEADFLKYMEDENKARIFDLRLMVFTNIEGKGSRFIYTGKLSNFFMGTIKDFEKQGVVSRKKQIVPRLSTELA